MVTKPEHTKSSEIGTLTTNIKELQKNPIMIPISDYQKGSSLFEKEDEREVNNLQKITEKLTTLKQTGIYDDSQIAIVYNEVVGIWERLAWIYKKNVSLANSQIAEMKKVVENFYITKEKLVEETKFLENEIKKLKEKYIPQKFPKVIPKIEVTDD